VILKEYFILLSAQSTAYNKVAMFLNNFILYELYSVSFFPLLKMYFSE